MGDEMVTKGDKWGDGKFAYESGAVYNTSIVMYDVQVERENQEAMTPQVTVSARAHSHYFIEQVVKTLFNFG